MLMVSRKSISDIIDKCWTKAQLHEKLSNISRKEKTKLLEGKLTPLEWEDYNNELRNFSNVEDILKEWIDRDTVTRLMFSNNDYILQNIIDRNKRINERLFQYDKRIFDGSSDITEKEVTVDESRFKSDKDNWDIKLADDDILIEDLERTQIEHQQENSKFTELEKNRINDYFYNDFNTATYINSRLNDGEIYKELDSEEARYYDNQFNNIVRSMDNCINKSTGLVTDTRLYRGGEVDIHLVPGMHGTFKGYTSTSFQKLSAKSIAEENDGWLVEILAPKGTKGVCANDHMNFDNNGFVFEHEYLLGRNTGYTVVSMDYENKVQVILLD